MRENTIIIEKLKGVELQIRYKYKSVYEDIWVHQKLFLNIQKVYTVMEFPLKDISLNMSNMDG